MYQTHYRKDVIKAIIAVVIFVTLASWFFMHTPCERMPSQKISQWFYNHGMTGLDGDRDNVACENKN